MCTPLSHRWTLCITCRYCVKTAKLKMGIF